MERLQAVRESEKLWRTMVEEGRTEAKDKHVVCGELFGDYRHSCPMCQYTSKGGAVFVGYWADCPGCPYLEVMGYHCMSEHSPFLK